MKAYQEYKEVSLDFLDSIPKGWDITKLKYLSSINFSNVDKHTIEGEIPVLLCNYVDVYKNDFIKPDMEFMKATATDVEISKFTLRKGDVLITKDSESWEDIAVPAFVTENMDGVLCGYHLAQIRPSSISGNFLFWVLCSSTLNDQYKVEAHGITRYGLGKDSIENSIIPVPSLPEQQAIADFLDRKTAQIDTLIAKKQRQIDLLQEQRTALINHAVTKGLNPTVKMKDSGVEWLGEIPSHWTMARLRWVTKSVVTGKTPPTAQQEYYENADINWFAPGDFNNQMVLKQSNKKINKLAIEDGQAPIYEKDTVLLVGIGATLGKVGIIEQTASSNQQINAISYNEKIYPLYGSYYLSAIKSAIVSQANFATLPILNQSQTKDIWHLIPPYDEQIELMRYVQKKEKQIQDSIDIQQMMIEYYSEYRTALISEAVTGKIDVRGDR